MPHAPNGFQVGYTVSVRLGAWLNAALDFCFPGTCCACQSSCDSRSPLCEKCLAQLDALATSPACGRCAAPSPYPDAPCPHCRGEGLKPFDRIIAIGLFDEPIRGMVHAIKYHRAWPLAEYLAEYLVAREAAKGLLTEAEVLVPVPLHPLRQIARGYNQASLIATRLKRKCGVGVAEPLIRIRATETQTHLHSRAKREANLRDAFALDSASAIRGKHVVLVDDVMTTGATLRSAARALRPAKPASLSALVLAIADPRGRAFERV